MKFFKYILICCLYCLLFVSVINITASAINKKLETLSLKEVISIDGMISGQDDIITFIEFKIKNTDTESMKEQILNELEKLKSN
ncbi:MAG: hypothetical protein P8I02_00415 [Flavobacteriales bacterium]|nr:hypothetical protein [Flavobacteriales bacterium]